MLACVHFMLDRTVTMLLTHYCTACNQEKDGEEHYQNQLEHVCLSA